MHSVLFAAATLALSPTPPPTGDPAPTPQRWVLDLDSGRLWPEAAERLGLSAYVTVESTGYGQVILFAANPAYRGITRGTARLFSNAVVYGPGVGASAPVPR